MEIKENEQLNVITDNSKVNINLLKQIEILKGENEDKDEIIEQLTNRFNTLNEENTKLKEALKDIRSQLFDSKNCETILTKSIDALLKD
jgi:predicted nuclease with TOPRIM domain